jgi:predicted acetyltransferase
MEYELRQLSINEGIDIYEMLQEIPYDENGFQNSSHGRSFQEFQSWLILDDEISKAIGLESWMVPSTTYWLYVDGHPVGMAKLRHSLTDKLREEGGNIGYAVRPGERGKGYGTILLKLVLEKAKKLEIDKVLITVRNDNTASIKVALKNGGYVEKISDIRHYIWIDC